MMSSDPIKAHFDDVRKRVQCQSVDPALKESAEAFFNRSHELQYSYNFTWLGRPIIQYPQDIVAFQEVVSHCKPDLIIETGMRMGDRLILSASLCLLDVMEGVDPRYHLAKLLG